MKKQAVLSTLINKLLGVIVIAFTGICLSFSAQAKQTVLLDANGKPLSEEMLLLLSTAPRTSNKSKTPKMKAKVAKKPASRVGSQIKVKRHRHVSNPLLEQEMLDAMKAGRVQRVKQLLAAGIAPTFKNYKGETPLGVAVANGWASMVLELLENGANINEKGARGVTLLHVASAKGLTDVAKLLVRGGLNPSQKTDKNWTPLHVAARYGHWQLVQYYISIGVDPDIRNSDGQTALGLARHLRHQGIIKILSRVTRQRSLAFNEVNQQKIKKSKKKSKKRRKKRK